MSPQSYSLPSILITVLLLNNTCSAGAIADNKVPLACSSSSVTALDVGNSKEHSRVEIRDTEVRILKSQYVDQVYEIDIWFPKSYETKTKTYPVVYVLDAEYNFGCVSYIARRLIKNGDIPEVLLVGIAYNSSYDEFQKQRIRDCTPPSTIHGYHTGGVEDFILFLRNELIPFINDNYRTIPVDRTITGHSIGGLFACYVLFRHSDLFNRYIIVSPSLWYSNEIVFEYEKEYANSHRDLEASIYLSTGMDESERMVRTSRYFTGVLSGRGYNSLRLEAVMAEGEHHRSLFAQAFTKGMRFVFSDVAVGEQK